MELLRTTSRFHEKHLGLYCRGSIVTDRFWVCCMSEDDEVGLGEKSSWNAYCIAKVDGSVPICTRVFEAYQFQVPIETRSTVKIHSKSCENT